MASDWERLISDWEGVVNAFVEGKRVQGIIFKQVRGGYFVKIGEKKGGYLPKSQAPEVCAVGMEFPFKVVGLRPSQWFLLSSRDYPEATTHGTDWYRIINAYKNGDTIQGVITDMTPKGLKMKIGDMEAFLPGGEIDVDPSMFRTLIGKTMKVKVICIDYKGKVSVSGTR